MKLSLATALFALLGFLSINLSPLHAAAADPSKPKALPFHGKLKAVDTTAQDITIEGKKADRVFYLTPTTKITDGAGEASTLSAATVGEDVGGSYVKDATGKMMLNSVRFGAKVGGKTGAKAGKDTPTPFTPQGSAPAAAAPVVPKASTPPPAPATATTPEAAAAPAPAAAPEAAAASKPKAQSFSGKVVSVDATSNTFVVHGKADQTFTVTATTKITGVDGLASVTAGSKVSGRYTKSADGATLTVSSLKVTPAK